MVRIGMATLAFAIAAAPVQAQNNELQQLREELRRLQQRIEQLEKTQERPAAPPASARVAPDSASNPAIGLILQGTVARSRLDPASYQISGFAPTGGEVGPAPRSFSIGESELSFSANIDPYFRGVLIAALTPESEAEVEEAYVQTLALGRGFTAKFGRFLSGVGYQNEIHQHAWDFQGPPLAYKAFLGGRLNDDAVQLRWLAPTDLFLELGGELGRGRGFPAAESSRNTAGLVTLFGHAGGDIGRSTAWRGGLSLVNASPQDRNQDDPGGAFTQSFTGRSRIWIADAVLKSGALKAQAEHFWRRESGTLTHAGATGDYSSRQRGWYAQGVYEFMQRWRAGYRYDRLSHGSVSSGLGLTAALDPVLLSDHNPSRNTLMVDWSPTEFSRIRLQFAHDKSRVGQTDHQLLLQYIHSLGAHGAHRF